MGNDDIEIEDIEILAWENLLGETGEPIPFSPEKANELKERHPELFERIKAHIRKERAEETAIEAMQEAYNRKKQEETP